MCFGGPEPQDATQQETAASRAAVDKYNEWNSDGYRGLERDAIREAGHDYTDTIRGLSSAEQAKQEGQAYQLAAPGRRALDFASVGSSSESAGFALDANARKAARNIKDERTFGVIETGQQRANNSASALMTGAANSVRKSLGDMEAQLIRQSARNKQFAQIAGAGASAYGYHKADMDFKNSLKSDLVGKSSPAPSYRSLDSWGIK